jgi:hypothetical protein
VTASSSGKSNAVWLAILFAAVAVLFGSLLTAGPLTWDDDSNIFNNPFFVNGQWAALWKDPYMGLYIPVTGMVWEMLYRLGEGSAVPFRALNLLLHLANSAMVYLLLRGLAKRWTLPALSVLIGTAIFALHPMQVQAVAWISGGRDLLAAFFALAGLCAYFGGGEKTSHSRFALATALFLTSMLCKPGTAILPAVVLALETILSRRVTGLTVLRMALWAFFAGAVAWLTKMAQEDLAVANLSVGDRLTVVFDTFSFYLQKFVAPVQLTANYARTPEAALADGTVTASVVMALAVLAGFAFLSWRRDRRYLLIVIWFIAMLPISGIVTFPHQEISTVADHYNYLPMALLAALAAFVVSRIAIPKAAGHAVLLVLVAAMALLSWDRARTWTGDAVFFTDMSKHSPDSYATALGMSIVMCEDLEQFEEGVKWTETALKAKPLDIVALANQAFCFLHAKNYFRVIELEYYIGQLDIDELEQKEPTAYSSLLSSIGSAYIEQEEYEDGFQFLCEAYRVKPDEPGHLNNLNIAKDLLKSKGIEPTCEQVQPEQDEGVAPDPIQEIWPQFEQGPDGGGDDSDKGED